MENDRIFCSGDICFDEIGYWSEIKLDIVKEYAQAYSRILKAHNFSIAYIDGFAGSGVHLSRSTKDFVSGSPLNALKIEPPFNDYFLIDLDGNKTDQLRGFQEVTEREGVHIINGDCNNVLLGEVFPQVRYNNYRRALCVLDPYGLHLNWEVIETAGRMKSIEIFLNFPIMDINRNALWHRPDAASAEGQARMTAYWGDESWKQAAYRKERMLFGDDDEVKRDNEEVVNAFMKRIKSKAGFKYVPAPVPMRNAKNAVIYYLFFASQNPTASKIVNDIFEKYKNRSV
jgi:three-Cys-motif partner protein